MAQLNEQERVEAITSAKPYYSIESVLPGSKVRYCGQTLWQMTTLNDLHVTLHIDFPFGIDIEKE